MKRTILIPVALSCCAELAVAQNTRPVIFSIDYGSPTTGINDPSGGGSSTKDIS